MNNPPHHPLDSLVSFEKIFKVLHQNQLQLEPFLPHQFKPYAQDILNVKGNPLFGLWGGMIDCASGLFLYALGGKLSKSFTSLSLLERYTLAASPLLLGGCLRIWAASQTDLGKGKNTILQLLGFSLLGVVGHVIMLSLDIDLSQVNIQSPYYYIFLLNNILTGIGIATYSAGMALGAQAAPQDNPKAWLQHLVITSDTLGYPVHPDYFENKLSPILRSSSGQYLALIACLSNFAPGLTLIIANSLIPSIGLCNTYIFFASMTGLGMLTTYYCVQNSIFDQLKEINPIINPVDARQIASYMGQRTFPLEEPFFQRLRDLNSFEKSEIIKATVDYTVTFGLLTALTAIGPIILENKGTSPNNAVLTMAGVSMLSSLMRGLMTLSPACIKNDHWMRASLSMMLFCSITLKFAQDLNIIQINMLVFGIFNGIGNFCVVDRISQKIPQDIGLATGISSGLAAFLAFPISILLAQEDFCFMVICTLGLAYHGYHGVLEYLRDQNGHDRISSHENLENIDIEQEIELHVTPP